MTDNPNTKPVSGHQPKYTKSLIQSISSELSPESGSTEPFDFSHLPEEIASPYLTSLKKLLCKGIDTLEEIENKLATKKQLDQSGLSYLAHILENAESELWALTYAGGDDRRKVLRKLILNFEVDSSDVEIKIQKNLVMFRFPYLPPKANKKCQLAVDHLAAAIFNTPSFPNWNAAHLVFTHVYPPQSKKIPRDVENYEYKAAIDLICYALGVSDGASTFSVEMRSLFTSDLLPGTYVFAFPNLPEKFEISLWLGK